MKGSNFDCSKCKKEVQKLRGCHINSYDLDSKKAKAIPIKIIEQGKFHSFCPSKPFRDNPEIILKLESIYASWKTGQPLEQFGIETNSDTLTLLTHMIRLIETYTRNENYKMIGSMFGGGEKPSNEINKFKE